MTSKELIKRVIHRDAPPRIGFNFKGRVGEGRLLVCSFQFNDDDPAAIWLKARLAAYAASESFSPALKLEMEQLRAVIDAPLLSGAVNDNRARNPADSSSNVRAGRYARP